jgi:hypothetical protein
MIRSENGEKVDVVTRSSICDGKSNMDLMKPINISSDRLAPDNPFTAVEMGKLWATYIGSSMSNRILQYFLKNVEDEYIKTLLENGLALIPLTLFSL